MSGEPGKEATKESAEVSEYIADFKDATNNIYKSAELLSNIAGRYSQMSPGQKPSYAGMVLIGCAVILNFLPQWTPSETFNIIMLLSGVTSLAIGAAFEAWISYYQLRGLTKRQEELSQQLKAAGEKRDSLTDWLLGRKPERLSHHSS